MAKTPMNPLAGPSGPGDKSKRTDQLTLGSAFYADDLAKLNTAAPKSKTRGVADNVGGRPKSLSTEPVTPLFAQSKKMDEPITSGIDLGDGLGSSALLMQSQFANNKVSTSLEQMLPYDQTGEIAILYQQALARGM
jgi:mevalonate kinase